MSKSLRDDIRTILAVGIAAVVMSPAALAQEQQKPEEQKKEKAASETEFQEVVVTGSRIRRTEFESPDPVTVITSERSQLAGLLSTEQILQKTTAAAQGQQINDSFSGFVVDGGVGANTISLRGLGAQRTLVLVNGKRWSPSGVQGATNSVDLTAIPSSIISRIEILKDGASSVYGADAVAGVINVITKDSFDGLQLNGVGAATHDGGGERYGFDASWGKVGDRGSFSLSASYVEQKEMVRADRDWSRCAFLKRWTDQSPVNGVIDGRDPDTGKPLCYEAQIYTQTAFEVFRYEPSLTDPYDTSNPYYDPLTAALSNSAVAAGGSPIQFFTRVPPNGFAPGQPPLGATGPRPLPYYENEGRWLRMDKNPEVGQLQIPQKIYSATSFGQLDFDLGAGTSTAYYEAFFNRRESRSRSGHAQLFAQNSSQYVRPLTYDNLNVNPYNPFGPLSPAIFVVPSYEIRDPTYYIDVDRYNVFAGLKGDLAGSWDYDIVAGYGHSKGTYEREQLLEDRVIAATTGVVIRPDGSITCADTFLAQWSNCVPVNWFTEDAQLRGILPQDALDFLKKMTKGTTVYESTSVSGYATGDLFSMPAGTVKAVIGAEYREESIDDQPDEEAVADNLWLFASALNTKGTDKVKEVFTEIEVPLLSGKRFAEDMYISASGRWTDYDSYGDDTTYKAAFNYRITPSVLFRSTYGTSFRAPDLFEQFLGDATSFAAAGNDPCTNYGTGNRQPGDPLYDNCAAQGLPIDFRAPSSIKQFTGGADDLEAETSDSLTMGIVLTPEGSGFSFAIDYFDIQVEDTVESPSSGFILFECYNSIGLSDPFCSRVGPRSAYIPGTNGGPGTGGEIEFVDASFVNIGKQQSRGFDFNFLYEHQFEVGSLTIDSMVTYLQKQNYELFGETTRLEGRVGFPRLSANAQIRYDWRDWRFGWFMNFIGESQEDPSVTYDPGTTTPDQQYRTPNYLTHTLSLRYQRSNWEAIGTVRNIFDKDPPYIGSIPLEVNRIANTMPGVGYDLLGRTYVLQLSYQF